MNGRREGGERGWEGSKGEGETKVKLDLAQKVANHRREPCDWVRKRDLIEWCLNPSSEDHYQEAQALGDNRVVKRIRIGTFAQATIADLECGKDTERKFCENNRLTRINKNRESKEFAHIPLFLPRKWPASK